MPSVYESLLEKMNGREYGEDRHYFMALCPFPHDGRLEQHPSFAVYKDGTFRCLTCHKFGRHEYLAKVVGAKGYKPQVTSCQIVLPHWRKWEELYGHSLTDIAFAAHKGMKRNKQDFYFRKRGIDQFIEIGRFGYLDGWCTFPVFSQDGQVVDIVCRNAEHKQYVVSPNETHPIYCPDWSRVVKADTVYVVYGMVDAWAMYAIGLPVVTGTSGKSLAADQLKPLDRNFVIVPDRYEEREAYQLAGALGWRAEVQRVKWPDDTKDPDDIRAKLGGDVLKQFVCPA